LRVPRGTGGSLRASLEMIPPDKRLAWRMHKVAEGETLASISKRYGAPVAMISAANKLLASDPVAGDRLAIPASYKEPVPVSMRTRTTAVRRSSGVRRPSAGTASAHRTANTGRRGGVKTVPAN